MTPLILSTVLSLWLGGTGFTPEPSFYAYSAQNVTYRTYQNARYNFSIAYPSTLMPEGEADNGDGQTFRSRDDTVLMRAWGSQNISNESLRAAYQAAIADFENSGGGSATYKFLGRGFFVVSGVREGKIVYQKTLMRGGTVKTFLIEYPEALQPTYDPITARIARSFKG